MIGKWHWSVWLRGLFSAAISGAATGVVAKFVLPAVAETVDPRILWKLAGVGALVGVCNYLKQSPLPQEDGIALPEARGFVRVAVLAAGLAGAAVAILVAVALHAAGLNAGGWVLLCIGAGVGQAWLVVRAFPAPQPPVRLP